MNTLLDSGRKIDGIVTSNEIQAQGVITAVKEHNIAIPAKIGVLSMGGTILSTIGSPKITILDFNPFKQGYEAAKLLIDVMERKRLRPFNFILPGELVEREST
jgi:DNA-binding LacI/PurR family transcriptional regulator